jgi:hypothetical protein
MVRVLLVVLVVLLLAGGITYLRSTRADDGRVEDLLNTPLPEDVTELTERPALSATPAPLPADIFAVAIAPTSCQAGFLESSPAQRSLERGTLAPLDQRIQRSNGLWVHDRDSDCWIRVNDSPIRLFSSQKAAESFRTSLQKGASMPEGRAPLVGNRCPAEYPVKARRGATPGAWTFMPLDDPRADTWRPDECFASVEQARASGYRPAPTPAPTASP